MSALEYKPRTWASQALIMPGKEPTSHSPTSPTPKGPLLDGNGRVRISPIDVGLVGALDAGKRCVADVLCQGSARVTYDPTDNYEYPADVFVREQKIPVIYRPFYTSSEDMWNTYVGIVRHYVGEMEACLLVYDVRKAESFQKIKDLYREADLQKYHYTTSTDHRIYFWLVATHIDLEQGTWNIGHSEGKLFASTIGADFVAVSCRTLEGFEGLKERIVETILEIRKGGLFRSTVPTSEGVTIENIENEIPRSPRTSKSQRLKSLFSRKQYR